MVREGALAIWIVAAGVLGTLTTGCSKSTRNEPPDGRALFASSCARCHGESGGGGLPVFSGGPSPRNFQDHAFQSERTDEQIKQVIVAGKGTGMPGFGRAFDDAQLAALVAYVRSLDPEGKR